MSIPRFTPLDDDGPEYWVPDDLCVCGHPSTDHVRLPGFPGGCEECQADDCECGAYSDAGGVQ